MARLTPKPSARDAATGFRVFMTRLVFFLVFVFLRFFATAHTPHGRWQILRARALGVKLSDRHISSVGAGTGDLKRRQLELSLSSGTRGLVPSSART